MVSVRDRRFERSVSRSCSLRFFPVKIGLAPSPSPTPDCYENDNNKTCIYAENPADDAAIPPSPLWDEAHNEPSKNISKSSFLSTLTYDAPFGEYQKQLNHFNDFIIKFFSDADMFSETLNEVQTTIINSANPPKNYTVDIVIQQCDEIINKGYAKITAKILNDFLQKNNFKKAHVIFTPDEAPEKPSTALQWVTPLLNRINHLQFIIDRKLHLKGNDEKLEHILALEKSQRLADAYCSQLSEKLKKTTGHDYVLMEKQLKEAEKNRENCSHELAQAKKPSLRKRIKSMFSGHEKVEVISGTNITSPSQRSASKSVP